MRKYFDEIRQIAGNVVTVNATGVGYDELAVIQSKYGESLAQVIRLSGQQVSVQVFAGSQGVSNTDRVRFCSAPCRCRSRKTFSAACSTAPDARATGGAR